MKEYYGNYLGICISNQDPEQRGRVQIFIPHIMPALYEDWNETGEDVTIECIGDNLQNGIKSDIVERLVKILPWAEGALPVVGTSVAGSYNGSTGNFNQLDVTENQASTIANSGSINPDTFGGSFSAELQDPEIQKKLFTLMEAEVGSQGSEAQLAWMETVRNRAYIQGTSINKIISNERYYEPYQTGAINRAAARLTDTKVSSYSSIVNQALQGSNITNGATHNASAGVAASVKKGGYDSVSSSIVDIGGETYYSKTNEQAKLAKLLQNVQAKLSDPSSLPPNSSLPPQASPFLTPESPVYTAREPSEQAIVSSQASPATGGKGNLQAAIAKASASTGVNFVTGRFPGMCAKATRSLANVCLGVGGHFGAIGSIGGSAKDTIGKNYWEREYTYKNPQTGEVKTGSLYERISTNNYVPQEGDVGITTGGEHGHAKIVVGGQFRSDRIDDSAANLNGSQTAAIYRLTPLGQELWARAGYGDATALGQPVPDMPAAATPEGTGIATDDVSSQLVKNTTETQPFTLDTAGMPQGLFAHPAPGALLWVFFREGNPLFPVYFAASYGATEWKNLAKAASPSPYYPSKENESEINNQAVIRPNLAGALVFNGSVTDSEDYRTVRMAHANGGYYELKPTGTVHYSPNEHMQHVTGTNYRYCLNNEEWVQGSDNRVTLGNQWVVIGNPSQANIETIEKLTERVKQINAKMLED